MTPRQGERPPPLLPALAGQDLCAGASLTYLRASVSGLRIAESIVLLTVIKQTVPSGTGSSSGLRLRPDSASACEWFRRRCGNAFMPPSLATQRPDGSSFTQHSPKKRAHVLRLGFSLANAAPGSSPASEPLGHKRLHFELKRRSRRR